MGLSCFLHNFYISGGYPVHKFTKVSLDLQDTRIC